MSNWKEKTLSEYCEFQEGYVNPPKGHSEYFGGDIKWCRAVDINNGYVYSTSQTLTDAGFNSAKKSAVLFKPNTIVITKSGTIGRLGINKDYMCGNRATINIIPKNNADVEFVFYLLRSRQNEFFDLAVGSVQKNLYVSILEKMMFKFPSLYEQKKIASFFSVIDKKIDINNRINRNLSEQAKILYKEWFIDFGPFEGEMPGDWHLGTVEEIIELHDSKRKPLSGRQRDDMEKIYPYYGATSIMDYVDNYIFDGIYLLLGEDGSVIDTEGYPILQYVFGKFWPNNHAHVITGEKGFSVEMLYLLFSLTNVQSIVTGAVQLKISQQNLKTVEVVIPSYEAITEFDEMIQPIFREIRRLRTENDKLTTLRDNLLPKLMSGELDVSDLDI